MTQKYQEVAKLEISRDHANQKTQLQQRLALRKMRMNHSKNNSNTSFDMLMNKGPLSTRNATLKMRPIKQGMLEFNAYLPTTPNAAPSPS